MPLRLGRELGGQDESGHGGDRRAVERRDQPLQPAGMQQHVVVGIGDDLGRDTEGAGIARDVQSRAILAQIGGARRQRDLASPPIARGVVHDDDFARAQALPGQRGEASGELVRPVPRADHDAGGQATERPASRASASIMARKAVSI